MKERWGRKFSEWTKDDNDKYCIRKEKKRNPKYREKLCTQRTSIIIKVSLIKTGMGTGQHEFISNHSY